MKSFLTDVRDGLAGLLLLCMDRVRGLPDPLHTTRIETQEKLNTYMVVSGIRDQDLALREALDSATIVAAYGITPEELRVVVEGHFRNGVRS